MQRLTVDLIAVSRWPSFSVSRNSPIYSNIEHFYQQIFENGVHTQYMRWLNLFLRHQGSRELENSDKKIIHVICVSHVVHYFMIAFLIQIIVFIGELLCRRFQISRERRLSKMEI